MFCQKCGKENHEGAQFCQNCGATLDATAQAGATPPAPSAFQQPVVTAQPPKKKKKAGKIVAIILGAIIVLVVLGNILGSNGTENDTTAAANADAKSSSSVEKPKEETIKISAVDILAEYEANAVKADSKYKGKMLEISGVIDDFGKDILDQTYITISDGKEFSTNDVQFYFDDSETSKVAELKKGDSVVIVGRCGEFNVFNLAVNDCKLK